MNIDKMISKLDELRLEARGCNATWANLTNLREILLAGKEPFKLNWIEDISARQEELEKRVAELDLYIEAIKRTYGEKLDMQAVEIVKLKKDALAVEKTHADLRYAPKKNGNRYVNHTMGGKPEAKPDDQIMKESSEAWNKYEAKPSATEGQGIEDGLWRKVACDPILNGVDDKQCRHIVDLIRSHSLPKDKIAIDRKVAEEWLSIMKDIVQDNDGCIEVWNLNLFNEVKKALGAERGEK